MSKQKNNLCTHVLRCSSHVMTGKSMNNLLSYCGLVVARISASEKDLPVLKLRSYYKIRKGFSLIFGVNEKK